MGGTTDLTSYGFQANWNPGDFALELEYVTGTYQESTSDAIDRNGYYGMISYTFADRYTPFFRAERFNPNVYKNDNEANIFIYGINIQLLDQLFLKCELNSVSSNINNASFNGDSYTEFKSAVSIGF